VWYGVPSTQLSCTFSFHNASTIDGLIDKEVLATVLNEDYLLRSSRHKTLLNQVIGMISVPQMHFAYVTIEIKNAYLLLSRNLVCLVVSTLACNSVVRIIEFSII